MQRYHDSHNVLQANRIPSVANWGNFSPFFGNLGNFYPNWEWGIPRGIKWKLGYFWGILKFLIYFVNCTEKQWNWIKFITIFVMNYFWQRCIHDLNRIYKSINHCQNCFFSQNGFLNIENGYYSVVFKSWYQFKALFTVFSVYHKYGEF